jgi:hypothetical protein
MTKNITNSVCLIFCYLRDATNFVIDLATLVVEIDAELLVSMFKLLIFNSQHHVCDASDLWIRN